MNLHFACNEIADPDTDQSLEDALKLRLGFTSTGHHAPGERERLLRYINLQLVANGWPGVLDEDKADFVQIARGLINRHQVISQQLPQQRCPADARIEAFLNSHFRDLERK